MVNTSAWSPRATTETDGEVSTTSRRRENSPGGLSLAFDGGSAKTSSDRIVHQFRTQRHVASSAPLNVPDWSKIYRIDSADSINDSDDTNYDMVPPHEYLARAHAQSRNSVFEGVGRTLKGRDMSRVRDAVWSQTGFDG